MDRLILGPVVPTFGSVVRKAADYGDQFAKMQDLINSGVLGTVGARIRDFIPVDGGTIPEIVVTPNGNYLPEQQDVQPVIIEENIIPQELNTYDRIEIEDPRKPKTYYASVDKMSFGGQINTETGFLDDLTMPIATGNHAERIMNRIDRRANRAVNRIENGRMNVRRWDRLGNQHARDLGRLNEINSVRWDLHLPGSRRNATEAVLNYLNSVGMNEVENLPKYPWHY